MTIKNKRRHRKQSGVIYSLVSAALMCSIFVATVGFFYAAAEDEAYETLHVQTKQIKDDLELQLLSDRENLATMASFASKLYNDGESYDLMFDSFNPIGLIANIGILNPDNTFVTKAGTVDLNGKISFEDEVKKGTYISGRVKDLTHADYEIIRSAVPIVSSDNTVGILYGVIKLDAINKKYETMADELDAQLFVYDKNTGYLLIDTIQQNHKNIVFLKDRKYQKGYSYEQMRNSEKGYSSFKSAYNDELLYLHFSELDNINWKIILARYESQVFAKTHEISRVLFVSFVLLVIIILLYVTFLLRRERQRTAINALASTIRKLLLEINQRQNNIYTALEKIATFSKARSAIFFDADGEEFAYITPSRAKDAVAVSSRKYFLSELLRHAAELYKSGSYAVGLMNITASAGLERKNPEFYAFLKKNKISELCFATVIDKNNHIALLGVINPHRNTAPKILLEDVAVCFSIALFNKTLCPR